MSIECDGTPISARAVEVCRLQEECLLVRRREVWQAVLEEKRKAEGRRQHVGVKGAVMSHMFEACLTAVRVRSLPARLFFPACSRVLCVRACACRQMCQPSPAR